MHRSFYRHLALISLLFSGLFAASTTLTFAPLTTETTFEVQSAIQTTAEVQVHSIILDETTARDEQIYTTVQIPGQYVTRTPGAPQLPAFHYLLELPFESHPTITISGGTETVIDLSGEGFDHPLFPAQPSVAKNQDPDTLPFEKETGIYQSQNLYSPSPVEIIPKGYLRDVYLVLIKIHPVAWHPQRNELILRNDFSITIDYPDGNMNQTNRVKNKLHSPVFQPVYKQIKSLIPESGNRDDLTTLPIHFAIVTPADFQDALEPFIAWKQAQGMRVTTGVVGVDMGNTSSAIQTWLHDLYNSGTTELPAPSYVMLVGDTPQIPAFNGPSGSHKTDLPYVDVTNDGLPDMYLGRLPAPSVTQITDIIDKTLLYEQYSMSDPFYLNEVTMIAGVDSYYGSSHANGQINYGTNHYFNPAHDIVSHTYLYPASGSSESSILSDMNNGITFINYTAHGNETSWADPTVTVSNVHSLSNSGQYFTAIANACLTAKFDYSECIGEAFIRQADGGAIGYIGGSNNTYWDEDYYWAVGNGPVVGSGATYEQTGLGVYDRWFHDHGEAPEDWIITNGAITVSGNLAVVESGSSLDNYYWEIYQLFGDPSLMAYLGEPGEADVTLPPAYVLGTGEMTISGPAHAFVGIAQNDSLVLAGQIPASGDWNVSVPNDLLLPGEMMVTITGQQIQPFTGSIPVVTPEGPYLIVNNHTVLDETTGNNNAQADYGETLQWGLDIKNVGIDTAYQVTVTLSTSDEFVSILDSTDSASILLAPDSILTLDDFELSIATGCPDLHDMDIQVHIQTTGYDWTVSIPLTGHAPNFVLTDVLVDDHANQRLDIGETAPIVLTLENQGSADADEISISLLSTDPYLEFQADEDFFNTAAAGETIQPYFQVYVYPTTQPGHEFSFQWYASTPIGYEAYSTFSLSAGLTIEDFETGDLSAFDWMMGGAAPWTITDGTVYEGTYALQSGDIGDNQHSDLSLDISLENPGEIRFMYKVSSEDGYDGLIFEIDGVEQDQGQGEIDWTEAIFDVPAGDHTLSWIYNKDQGVSEGSDCAWLDYIVLPIVGSNVWTCQPGDVNCDEVCDIQDMIRMMMIIIGQGLPPLDQEMYCGDMNYDGELDVFDLLELTDFMLENSD